MEKYVFISYSSHDKNVADAICHFLEGNGIPCWIAPRDILPGETWAGSIIKAIRNCSVMLLIYSKNSNESGQVANEVDKAFSNGKTIIPFMMDQTPLNDDFDYYLSRKHWLLAYPDYKTRFADLLNAVTKIVPPYEPSSNPAQGQESPSSNVSKNIIESSRSKEMVILQKMDVSEPESPKVKNVEQAESVKIVNSEEKTGEEAQSDEFTPIWSVDATEKQRSVISEILSNMVKVDGGTLELGATKEQLKWAKKNENPAHLVELSTFWICKFQVTQSEWDAIMNSDSSSDDNRKIPMNDVSLVDCREFVKILREKSGIDFALPTEAQWEFAARGGVKSEGFIYAGSNDLKEVAWYIWNSGGNIHPVGLLKPNELGLYDMSGNVSEWCDDLYGEYTGDLLKDPHNCYKKPGFWTSGNFTYRGGDYVSTKNCRVSYRDSMQETYKSKQLGLRLVIKPIKS